MSAFGPYAGTQVIDFRELGGRSFFLIHGPTGSGKTTILDAMCFALYGESSGALRDGRQMRSDHADLSAATELTFDFSIGAEVYRIKRNPEQERPRRRGAGTTVVKAGAALWKRTGLINDDEEGTVLAGGWNKVTEKIETLLGFKSSQFRQVVMLPQGEFRRLLTADSKERQAILETLFRAEFYRRIEDALKESAKAIKNKYDSMSLRQEIVLNESKAESQEELSRRHDGHKEQLKEVKKRIEAGQNSVKSAQERLNSGLQAKEKLDEKRNAGLALADLNSKAVYIDAKRVEAARARQALSLADIESALKRRRADAAIAAGAYEKRRKIKSEALNAKEKAEKVLAEEEKKGDEREKAGREVTRLEELTAKVAALDEARYKVDLAKKKMHSAEANRSRDQSSLAAIQDLLAKKDKARQNASEMAAQAAALKSACKEAEQIITKRQSLENLRGEMSIILKELDAAVRKLNRAEESYQKAKLELADLQEAWNSGQAAILAGALTDGAPCPVCGATDHPAPAVSKAALPSENDLKKKRLAVTNLESIRDKLRDELNGINSKKASAGGRIEELISELGEKAVLDLAVLQIAAAKNKDLLYKAEDAVKNSALLVKELEELKEKEKSAVDQLEISKKDFQDNKTAFESAQAVALERESGIPAELRDPLFLQKVRKDAGDRRERLIAAYERARKTAEEANRALARAETAEMEAKEAARLAAERAGIEEDNFQQRLTAAGFAARDDYQDAKRTPEETGKLEKEIKEFDGNLSAARDRLERAVRGAEGLSEPDLEKLNAALAEAENEWKQALKEGARLEEQTGRETGWLGQLAEIEGSLRELESRYAVLGRLSEVANGRNPYGLTFQRFVLGALLDDVLVAATRRLQLMSRGRYYLQRTMDRARSNAAGGLDLEVFDTYTGVARGVVTLSGGETFLASLSLALGLADVVQSYSGGIYLDTIFIDEGFGALDPESLDFAVRALIDLQKGGRLVGVISHVPELKEIIDSRLEISAGEHGSTAKFKLA
jgi:exonuclease SbcC